MLTLPQLYTAGVECGHMEARRELRRRVADVNDQLEEFRAVRDKAQGDREQLASDLLVAQRSIATLRLQWSSSQAQMMHLESEVTMPEGFILPGATAASGAIDLARAIARRAERRCVSLENAGGLDNPAVRRWLNRLSLLLFVLARYEENLAGRPAPPAKRSTARRSS